MKLSVVVFRPTVVRTVVCMHIFVRYKT